MKLSKGRINVTQSINHDETMLKQKKRLKTQSCHRKNTC